MGKPADRPPRSVEELWNEYAFLPDAELKVRIKELTPEELRRVEQAEIQGWRPGDLPIDLQSDRERALDSPYCFVTEICDSYYAEHLEPVHRVLLDEVAAPYLRGETVRIEGVNYDPHQYLGLLVLMTRTTFKSTLLGLLIFWDMLWMKLRAKQDARVMYVHQQIEKAVERGEVIRNHARHNDRFRKRFPEFAADPEQEWDRQDRWRWGNYRNFSAAEWSFKAYGERSNKTGGHYTLRAGDDLETEESVTTPEQLRQSESRFRMMDNLKVRDQKFNPQIVAGTTYHFQGLHAKLKREGGYLVYEIGAHTGSPKRIFDLVSVDRRTEAGRAKVERGLKELERDPPGRLNFPRLLGWRDLYLSALAQGPNHYNTQMLLNPVPEGEERFDHDLLDQAWVDELPPPEDTWIYIRCDPAIGVKKRNDETAILVGGVSWQGYRWVLDGWSGRENRPTEIVRKLYAFAHQWKRAGYQIKNIGIEAVQFQESLASLARLGVPDRDAQHGEQVNILGPPCIVRSIERSPDMRKEERILELDGPISRLELKIWRRCRIGDKLMTQLRNFPHDRDDLLDTLHDMWVKTPLPPRHRELDPVRMHPELAKLLGLERSETPRLVGTHQRVDLVGWD